MSFRALRDLLVLVLVWVTAICGLLGGFLSYSYHLIRSGFFSRTYPTCSIAVKIPVLQQKDSSFLPSSDLAASSDLLIKQKANKEASLSRNIISIIIPAKNEQASIARTIAACVGAASFPSRLEIIVALAECTDNTEEEVNKCISLHPALFALRTVKCGSGRSSPLNAGSRAATGKVLLFLHADLLMPLEFDVLVDTCMSNPKNLLGAFRFGWDLGPLSRAHPQVEPPRGVKAVATRIVQWLMPDLPDNVLNLPLPSGFLVSAYLFDVRGRLFLRPEGDQAIFLRQADYAELGEFLMDHCCFEDYEFVGRARAEAFRTGRKVQILPARVAASPRRELALGPLFTSAVNLVLYFLYDVCSLHPSKLFQVYYHPYVVRLADVFRNA